MNSIIQYIKSNKINIVMMIAWLIITIISLCHHEMWRDEARVWNIIENNSGIELYDAIRKDGHPFLWYIILLPFIRLGIEPISMQICSLILVFLAVVFFLHKSKLNYFAKFLFVFSAGMLYYLPIIARNYSLMPITLFLFAGIYTKRNTYPIIYALILCLISQTHALLWGLYFISTILFVIEEVKYIIKSREKMRVFSIILLTLNSLFLIYSYYDVIFNNSYINLSSNSLITFTLSELNTFLTTIKNTFAGSEFVVFTELLFIMGIIYILIKNNLKLFSIFSISLFSMYYILAKVWFNGIQYQKFIIFALLILVFTHIIEEKKYVNNKNLSIIMTVFLLIHFIFPFSGKLIQRDINDVFSFGPLVAQIVNERLKENEEVLLITYNYHYDSIIVEINKKNKEKIKYFEPMLTDEYLKNFSSSDINNYINNTQSNIKYVVINSPIIPNDMDIHFNKIYDSNTRNNIPETCGDEVFSLYKKK